MISTIMGIEKIKHLDAELPVVPWLWHTGASAQASWAQGMGMLQDWLQHHSLPARDTVVVLPQTAHMVLAKQAWSKVVGGWMPRFETVGSLLQRLAAPSQEPGAMGLVLDETLDLLWFSRQLRQSALGRRWLREAPAQADVAMTRMVALAHDWLKVCMGLPPDEREAWVGQTHQWCQQQKVQMPDTKTWQEADVEDLGARERWLAGLALDAAMQSWKPLAQRYQPLFEHDPAAWVLVTVGHAIVPGSDAALMQHVMHTAQARQTPVCWMPACWSGEWEVNTPAPDQTPKSWPTLTQAQHFNDEAQASAAWILAAVQRKRDSELRDPVVLVTQDRVLSRRVRALLMAHESAAGLVIQDESGWTLSTTRAAATVTRLLAAAQPSVDTWGVLDWLIQGWCVIPPEQGQVQALEMAWRQQQVTKPWVQASDTTVWPWAQQVLMPLHELAATPVPLVQALGRLQQVLEAAGAWAALQQDEAGKAVIKALRLMALQADDGNVSGDVLAGQWALLAQQHTVNLSALTDWVQQCLARVNFEPTVDAPTHTVDVVLTPMGRAALRPFACVVMPGVDEGQLGVMPPAGHLMGANEAGLGLPSPQQKWQSQWAAFALLAAQPEVRAVYRQSKDGGPVAPGAWLGRWWSLAQPGTWLEAHWPLAPDPRQMLLLSNQPMAPVNPGLMPADPLRPNKLSPSGYLRLRECPYRYFALDLLRLREPDEHDEGMAQQDYGNWLHEVLRRFHAPELEGRRQWLPEHDVQQWLAIAEEVAHEQGLHGVRKHAHLALYECTLEALASRYVSWHHEQQVEGWHPKQLEQQLSLTWSMPDASSLTLYGKLDRVDAKGAGANAQTRVIDYKTGSLISLKAKVKEPLEDTQLAFYALLVQQDTQEQALQAMYLHLNPEKVQSVVHPEVANSAAQLAEGIRSDMARIYQGHAMPAMGEGRLCERCEVRGLCRKDHQSGVAEVQS